MSTDRQTVAGNTTAVRRQGVVGQIAVCLTAVLLGLVANADEVPSTTNVGSRFVAVNGDATIPAAAPVFDFDSVLQRLGQLERQQQQRDETDWTKKVADAERPAIKWSGQLQADGLWFNQDVASRSAFGDIENGAAFRRARIAMFGDYGPIDYRIEMDYALSGRPTFLDVFVSLRDIPGIGRVRVGHFFEPFGLDRLTANRYLTFMERNLGDQAFSPARNLGVQASNSFDEQNGTWAVGLFRSDSNVFGDDSGDGFESAVTGRVTWLPWYDEENDGRHYLHLGAAYSWRDTNGDKVRFAAQPESRIGANTPNVPFVVDTGDIAAHDFQLLGLEAAWINGPFSVQSEFALVPVNPIGKSILFFHSWYVQSSFFLTGEHRPYRKETGSFDRVSPKRDFLRYASPGCVETGSGAWEVAMRLSQLDLNDNDVYGGRLTDLTFGVNWYLNRYLKMTANYIRAIADHPTVGRTHTDGFGMRVGFEF